MADVRAKPRLIQRLDRLHVTGKLKEFVVKVTSDAFVEVAEDLEAQQDLLATTLERNCKNRECLLNARQGDRIATLGDVAEDLRLRALFMRRAAGIEDDFSKGKAEVL